MKPWPPCLQAGSLLVSLMLQGSVWDQPEVGLQLNPWLCLASSPAPSCFAPSPQLLFLTASSVNLLHANVCLRVYFPENPG